MDKSIQERTIFGIAGISSFILRLYIGYRYLGIVEDVIPFFLYVGDQDTWIH